MSAAARKAPAAGAAAASAAARAGGAAGPAAAAAVSRIGTTLELALAKAAANNETLRREAAYVFGVQPRVPLVVHPRLGTLTLGEALPDVAPAPRAVALNKRLRLHPHWRLRAPRKWTDFAPLVKGIIIRFDPTVEGSSGARELARQVTGEKIRAKYPKMSVKVEKMEDDSLAVVVINWVNDKYSSFAAHYSSFDDILDSFEEDRDLLSREEADKEMQ